MNYYKLGHLKNTNLFSPSYGNQKCEIKVLAGLHSLRGYRGNSFLASLSVSSGDSYSLICSHVISIFVSVITWPPSRSTSLIRILIIGLRAHLHNTRSPYTLNSKFLIMCTKISFSFTGSRKWNIYGHPWWPRWQRIHLPIQEIQVQSLGQKDPLEKGMATHSSFLAWRIPWTEKAGGLQSMGLQRVGYDLATNIFFHFSWLWEGPHSARYT